MKKRFVYSFLAALAVCSCQVEEVNESALDSTQEVIREAKVFTAIIDDTTTPETRTSLDAEGNVLWKQGDQVSIFAGSTINEQYQVTDASDGKTAASLNKVSDPGFVAGTDIDHNVAFYPYASTAAIAKSASSYVISDITLPATQTYAKGSFGNGAFPMAAVTGSTGDMNLKFKNVLGGLKLQLKGTASIASISITGNNNEVLCGAAEVTVANGNTPSINLTDASAKTVTLDCGAGVALDSETATPFIIALPPMTMTSGFTVVVTDTEGKQMEISTSKSQTIKRSQLLKMPVKEMIADPVIQTIAGHNYVNLGLSVMWATCNIGATNCYDYGRYYGWGEISTKTSYTWNYYKFGNWNTISKYTLPDGETDCVHYDGNGVFIGDYKSVLESADDAASYYWNTNCRIPTSAEVLELLNTENCLWIWCPSGNTEFNGVAGYKVQSKKTGYTHNYIFLPAAGYKTENNTNNTGVTGRYWTSELGNLYSTVAECLHFYSSSTRSLSNTVFRYTGQSIRAVHSEDPNCGILGVTLDKSELIMEPGSCESLTATVSKQAWALNDMVLWKSSNSSIVKVDNQGNITAGTTAGTAVITVETVFGGFTASCTVRVGTFHNGYEYVDLGLNVKWATCNLGADNPYDYGIYYAWGETKGYNEEDTSNATNYNYASSYVKTYYYWNTYKYCDGSSYNGHAQGLTKYISSPLVLEPEDDAATVNWGSGWRMPTREDWIELSSSGKCTWTWTSMNGIKGWKVQSKITGYTDKYIFLPAAGYRSSSLYSGQPGTIGKYWSSSLESTQLYQGNTAHIFNINGSYYQVMTTERYYGLSVRPVTE